MVSASSRARLARICNQARAALQLPEFMIESEPRVDHLDRDLGPTRQSRHSVHAARPAGKKAMASISIFAFSNRPATCTAVLVGGSFGKPTRWLREVANARIHGTTGAIAHPQRNRWFARLFAGGEWIRTSSSAPNRQRLQGLARAARRRRPSALPAGWIRIAPGLTNPCTASLGSGSRGGAVSQSQFGAGSVRFGRLKLRLAGGV